MRFHSCFSATGRFHLAICPFRDYQLGIDRLVNALQFACALECFEKMLERPKRHGRLMCVPIQNGAMAEVIAQPYPTMRWNPTTRPFTKVTVLYGTCTVGGK